MPATDATSHRRRSSLVVLAASRRSRQRSSPLRGGHGGGLSSFAWRSRSRKQWRSFYTNFFFKTRSLRIWLPLLFHRRELLWVCAPPSQYLRRLALYFLRNRSQITPTNKPKKDYRRWPSAEVTEVNEADARKVEFWRETNNRSFVMSHDKLEPMTWAII